VRRLTRTQFGPVTLTGVKVGAMRELTDDELGTLLDSVGL
jgi:23S rRNA pseudouridine2605 synthase